MWIVTAEPCKNVAPMRAAKGINGSSSPGFSVDTAPEATEQATQAATGAVEGATEEATNTATDTATDVLSVDGFNLEQVTEMIDGSGLDGLRKETLKGALKNAAGNPELLQSVLDMVKDSLGQ